MPNQTHLERIKGYNIRQAAPRPAATALLVIDMQRYFAPMAAPIVENVRALLETCRARGILCIFTRHGHTDPARDGGMLAEWWGELIVRGSDDWPIMDAVAPRAGEPIIDKVRYSAFFGTDLEDTLRREGVTDLVITGVMTNCCCETTARDAFVRDYRVVIVADATATVNDDLHVSTLKNLAYGFAYVVGTHEFCTMIEGAER